MAMCHLELPWRCRGNGVPVRGGGRPGRPVGAATAQSAVAGAGAQAAIARAPCGGRSEGVQGLPAASCARKAASLRRAHSACNCEKKRLLMGTRRLSHSRVRRCRHTRAIQLHGPHSHSSRETCKLLHLQQGHFVQIWCKLSTALTRAMARPQRSPRQYSSLRGSSTQLPHPDLALAAPTLAQDLAESIPRLFSRYWSIPPCLPRRTGAH